MTFDGDQQMKLGYDINNLVHDVKKIQSQGQNQTEELTATYSYFADGTKYFIKDTDGNSRIYIGPFTLVRKEYGQGCSGDSGSGNNTSQYTTLLESVVILASDARFAFATTPHNPSGSDTTYTIAYETLYLQKDHLGSIRTITDSQGYTLERNDYYPYGLQTDLGRNYASLDDKYRVRLPASFTSGNPSISSLSSPSLAMTPLLILYNGKEMQMVAKTCFVDYGARQFNATLIRWNAPDQLSESAYNKSSNVYCGGDPINYADLGGLATDWVQKPSGEIAWDPNATSPETTASGDIYIGPSFRDLEYQYNDDGTKTPIIHALSAITVSGEASPHGRIMMNPIAQAVWAGQKAFMDHPITRGTICVLTSLVTSGITSSMSVASTTFKVTSTTAKAWKIGTTGHIGEEALQSLGGISQKAFSTPLGRRVVDQFVKGVAHESKVGYTSATKFIKTQIAKETFLLSKGELKQSIWHFYRSPITGKIGATKNLINLLKSNNITVVIHE